MSNNMFENCTSLVGAPRLRCNELIYEEFPKPSTKLPFEYWVCCTFNKMFKGCTALEKVRFAKELESNEKFRSALEHSSCFGAVNAKAVFDL